MIGKGTTHDSGGRLAVYMTTGKEHEQAELWELRGFAAEDIKDAFRDVHIMAAATRCEKPFFHVQVRNPEGENLTNEQWQRVADRIESKLGYRDQPRAIAFHIDTRTGDRHMHIAWSRIDDETMTARPLPFFKLRLKTACRELETELGLTPVKNERDTPVMAPSRNEIEQARRLGVDIRQVRETIRDCWDHSDGGRAFTAALADQGLTLAKGDQRDFVVLDPQGGMHVLSKRILGVTAAQTRARMGDIDRDTLPTVDQGREQIERTRAAAIEKEKQERGFAEAAKTTTGAVAKEKELDQTAADIRLAYSLSRSAAGFADALAERGIHLAAATKTEAEHSQAEAAAARKQGRQVPAWREGEVVAVNQFGRVYTLDRHTTGDDRGDSKKLVATIDRGRLQGIETTQTELALRAEKFIALTQVGALDRAPEKPAAAEPQKRDWRRMLTDPEYRRQIQAEDRQRRDQERPNTPDRGRGGRER